MGKILWACFALSAFFLDLSFVLVVTDVQSTATVDNELERLTTRQDAAEDQVTALQQQYDAAVSRATMDQLADQIKVAEQKAETYRRDRQERLGRVEAGETKPITSTALSTAIFDAASSGRPGRITFLVLFALIFAGLQLTMITAAGASFAEKPELPEPDATHPVAHRRRFATDDVSKWVSVTWNYVRNGRSADAPVSRASFEKIAKGRFSMQLWDDLMARSIDLGLIVDGKITEPDQQKAKDLLTKQQ